VIIVLGAALVFAAIVLLVLGLAWQTPNPMDARIMAIRGERASLDFAMSEGPASARSRLFGPMAESLAGTVKKLLPINWVKGIERRLVMAGEPTTLSGFLIGSVMADAVLVLLAITLVSSSGASGMNLLMLGVIGVIGFVGPKIWLDNRVRHRQKEILKSLPDAFDLITTCVEAGLGLEAALARVAEKTAGAFAATP
jgi:tight adherence protein C